MKYIEEKIMKVLMIISTFIIIGSLFFIFIITIIKGGGSIIADPGIIISTPGPRYLLGGSGGFFHAIIGSFVMVIPATILASILSCMIGVYLQPEYSNKKIGDVVRVILDILWGTPSIIYGICV